MIILTDCDGVLLNWAQSFHWWMHRKGYRPIYPNAYAMDECYGISRSESKELCVTFCESAAVGFLPPLRDAIKYVRKLHEEHGVVFHCITSMGTDPWAIKLREENLARVFGEGVFERVVCLGCGEDKDKALERYRDSDFIWIEDKAENAELGAKMGLNSFLLSHTYYENYNLNDDVTRVNNWKEIYDHIA